jgi:hypothetical protein
LYFSILTPCNGRATGGNEIIDTKAAHNTACFLTLELLIVSRLPFHFFRVTLNPLQLKESRTEAIRAACDENARFDAIHIATAGQDHDPDFLLADHCWKHSFEN